MAEGSIWTTATVERARKILRKHESLATALREISTALGRAVSSDSLYSAFKRFGHPSPQSHLLAPSDPIKEQTKRDEDARKNRQIQNLVQEVKQLRARLAFVESIKEQADPPRIIPREKTGLREMTAVVLASDWHIEETIDPASVSYRNSYNLDISSERVDRFFQAISWNVEHQRASDRISIRDMVLWLGGDLITGYIHEELVESNSLSPTEAILWLLPRLEGGIRSVVDRLDLEQLVIPCSYGNHGRTTQKTRISTGYANSYEWLMYNVLADRLRDDKRVRFEITPSAHQYVKVYDQLIHFHHGDDVKYVGGIGGISVPLLKAVAAWDLVNRADIHCMGHWHMLRDFGRAVVNGSLIGYGPFSQKIRAEFEVPQQAMFYVDSKRGKTMLTHLWVGDSDESKRAA